MDLLSLGVDLGGTKTEAVILRRFASEEYEIVARRRVPTDASSYEGVLASAAHAIEEVTREAGLGEPPPIGVGMPGSTTVRTRAGTEEKAGAGRLPVVKNSNTTVLNGRPFRHDLIARVGRPIAFANDANCFAVAEAMYGAGRGHPIVFGVILGTGVGGGVAIRDDRRRVRAWDGAQGVAGEWGHIALEPVNGPLCYCGRRGCVERFIGGPRVEEAYAARAGVRRPLAEIAARRTEDVHARAVIAELIEIFGRGLAVVVDVLDPSVIVLGGGVSNLEPLYDEGVRAVERWAFTDQLQTPIVRNALGDSAGVIGAALLPASEAREASEECAGGVNSDSFRP